ncbi:histidine kinase dimerization/phospho-acceptor domain-containing protein, partial [Paraburkholderia caledonica]|uniref:histidine kinase dimerization/phospho-acceptor domain-containing protein n=1 Tax=Paraburkholderia caledonica TaxID=134536 RepID=UPI00277D0DC0
EERLRHAQSELERVSRLTALGELSASIAHEVGQPLSAIVTNGEACLRWLHRQPPDMEEIEGCVSQMTGEANRAAEIVQRVRALMKGRRRTGHRLQSTMWSRMRLPLSGGILSARVAR